MKTIYRRKWTEDAVSPVIATILMVAITVVLAAVLYLLVSGLIGGGTTAEPNVSLGAGTPTATSGQFKVGVDSVSRGEALANYKVSVLNGTTIAVAATTLDTVKSGGASGGGLTLAFSDATNDDRLNSGDWFTLSGTGSGYTYQVTVFWTSTGNRVSGDTGKVVR